MKHYAAFGIAIVLLGILGFVGLAMYMPDASPHIETITADGERTIILELLWGGDTYRSEEASCDVWTGQFDCELRRGGGLGTVMTQTMPLTGPLANADPPEAGVVITTTLAWDISDLAVGHYESWCRLGLTNKRTSIWGYIEGEGQELDGWCLADKIYIGQTCIVPRRFMVAQ